jgi:preprotein translocase subunit SecF
MSRLGSIPARLYRGEVSVEFVGRKKIWFAISGAILVISIAALLLRGLNYSVEFKGGSIFQFQAPDATQTQITNVVAGAGGGNDVIVQHTGGGFGLKPQWQVQTEKLTQPQTQAVTNAITSHVHPTSSVSSTFVSPTWGSQISQKAIEALIAFLVAIVIYLSIAFDWKMASSALVALAHDIVIAVGIYALAGFQVSPATVIGLLTILGYSLYDTVVVFDKVRENTAGLAGTRRSTYSQAANLALNQTLVRSINTSVIALLPVVAILIVSVTLLPPGELSDLALVLFVGMLSGTYSSIFIATPVLAALKEREPQYRELARRVALREAGGRAALRARARAERAGVPAGQRAGRGASPPVSPGGPGAPGAPGAPGDGQGPHGPADEMADLDVAGADAGGLDPGPPPPSGPGGRSGPAAADDASQRGGPAAPDGHGGRLPDSRPAAGAGAAPGGTPGSSGHAGRQQPRRTGRAGSRRRPAGKKKRR